MAEKKVWLITGAGRGMGVDIAKAAIESDRDLSTSLALDERRPAESRR